MPRFFVDTEPVGEYIIDGESGRHICRSLRMRAGEKLTLCDGKGTDYFCEIISAEGNTAAVRVLEKKPVSSEPKTKLTIYQGLPKGDKLELIIQKAVELGANEIVPTISQNCVSKLNGKEDKKLERWNKIALEAAKQSGRGIIPQVLPAESYKEAMKNFKGKKLFFYEGGGKDLSEALKCDEKENGDNVAVFIGPEGGFTPEEAELAKDCGAETVGLGPRILRTETAAITAAALVMYLAGNM